MGHRRVLQISRHKNSSHGHYNDRGGFYANFAGWLWLAGHNAHWLELMLQPSGPSLVLSSPVLTPHNWLLTNKQSAFLSLQEFGDSARARRLYADDDDDEEEQELEPNPKLAQGRQSEMVGETNN